MPIILRCNECKKETEDNPSKGLRGSAWTKKSLIGGTLVLRPECQRNEDVRNTDTKIQEMTTDMVNVLSRNKPKKE